MAEFDSDSNYLGRRYIETSGMVLGLSTPASRMAQPLETPKYSSNQLLSPNLGAADNENLVPVSNLAEGEIMKGLNVDDALLPSRRHLIKEISGLVDHSENLILSLAALRVLAQISHLHQFEPDPSLASVAPNRLFSILQEESGCLEKIKNNFRRRLEREETENVQFLADGRNFPHLISTWLLLNAQGDEIERIMSPDFTDAFGLTNYIRLFIVNFFASNVSKRSFNLAHFILGFSQDSKELCASGCLSLLIDMLMYGLGHPSVEAPVIFIEHPALGLKLLSFLKSLLMAPNQFSKPALAYLRHERQLFLEFARSINTRLLQVSFSTEKGYALSTEFESIKSSDFHFNVFELLQKAELFEILAMDMHEASSNGSEDLYLEQLLEYLVVSSNQDSPLGEARAILFLSAIDNITEDAYIKRLRSQSDGEFGAALVSEFEEACTSYIVSLSTLIGELLATLHGEDGKSPSSFAQFSKEKEQFIEALQVWIWKFMQKSTLSASAIEALIQLNVLIGGSSNHLQNNDSLEAQIAVLLRPEISVTTRCYIYTVLMNQDSEMIGQYLPEDRFLRLVELVTRDASNTAYGAINDSLVTVALAALEFLNRARPSLLLEALLANSNSATSTSLSYIVPTAINSTAPFISSLLSSLTVDDGLACSLILSQSQSKSLSEEDLSIFLKWRAKWSLLLNLVLKETGNENDSVEASSSFAHRFIDGGFLEAVLFKLKCLSLNVAYRIADSSQLILLTIFPVLKFLCALGMASDRRTAISSRLLSHFRASDALDALIVISAWSVSESAASSHAAVIHCIFVLVNGVIEEAAGGSNIEELSAKLISFRQAVLNQIVQKSRWIHRIGRISAGSLTFVDEELSARLQTEIQVLEESIHFLSREKSISEIFSSNLTAEMIEEKSVTSLSLGTLIFLLKTCIAKLKEGRERADLLEYYAKNLDSLSPSDLGALFASSDAKEMQINSVEAVKNRIDFIYREISELQSHLLLLIEKTCFLLLKCLRLKLNCIIGGPGSTSYVDSRSPQVQAARSLKTDASIIILPILDSYQKSIRLVESSANFSLYMNALVQDFFSLLSSNSASSIHHSGLFEI